jgi:hypothetical protein
VARATFFLVEVVFLLVVGFTDVFNVVAVAFLVVEVIL